MSSDTRFNSRQDSVNLRWALLIALLMFVIALFVPPIPAHDNQGVSSQTVTSPHRFIRDAFSTPLVASAQNSLGNEILKQAVAKYGAPYANGAEGPDSFDCSGYAYWAMTHAGLDVPRLSADGYAHASFLTTVSMSNIEIGDMVIFKRKGSSRYSHIGIYAGGGMFANAVDFGTPAKPSRLAGMTKNYSVLVRRP